MKRTGLFFPKQAFGFVILALGAAAFAGLSFMTEQAEPSSRVTPELLKGLEWRAVGPTIFGGRVTDVAGVPGDPNIIYVAHASAGLFKSTNGGTTFQSVFNDAGTLSIGAIALAPNNPEVVYVGTGEGKPRNSVSYGDGIYKSIDGGRTWTNLGLKDTERFSRIAVNPVRPEIVFAAAMGHEWGPNRERGIFRSTDGGANWKNVLFINDTTGASDLCLDPKNPRIVYAAMYDYLRQPWFFRSGGPGSGLYRSTDGGGTWIRLSDPALNNGLPSAGVLGRIGLAVSQSRPNVVYAMIESEDAYELWRSDDRGNSWKGVSAQPEINARPFYFSVIRVDPEDENRVYSLNRSMWVSSDGGKTFKEIGYWKIFGDHHGLWIDPRNAKRILNGSDGGFHISNDRGATWEFINTLPFAQAYHIGLDMADPYNVLGGFQDHEVWRGPNEKWNVRGVKDGDWVRLRDHGDGMYVLADPRDPNIIYYNCEPADITRLDFRTGEERFIQPYPVAPSGTGAGSRLYRFNWNSPIHISPRDPDVVYFGGNVVFKTTDGGFSWEIISPDLTTNDKQKQKLSGGPITPDNSNAEVYCTILAISESPRDGKTIWVGTDDGNIQLTRDGGKAWTNVAKNVQGLPAGAWVSAVNASPHDTGTAYVSVDQHRLDDFLPYAYKTTDYGKTWKLISQGLRGYVHIVIEDPKEPDLLYAGTELGVFASFDGGGGWTDLRLGLPRLSVMDIKVHPRDNDLVMATHARGIYILDDVTPLQELARLAKNGARQGKNGLDEVILFKPMRATRYTPMSDVSSLSDRVFFAKNQPYGAIVTYYLPEMSARRPAQVQDHGLEKRGGNDQGPSKMDEEPNRKTLDGQSPGQKVEAPEEPSVKIEILDASGRVIRRLRETKQAGMNRVVWGLREDPVAGFSEIQDEMWFNPRVDGPRVLPGVYRVRLTALGETLEQSFEVRLDPRLKLSRGELAAYGQAIKKLAGMQFQVNMALEKIRKAESQVSDFEKTATDPEMKKKAGSVCQDLKAIREEFRPDPLFPERLNLESRVLALRQQVENHTGRPTESQAEWIDNFDRELTKLLEKLESLLQDAAGGLNLRIP